MSRLNYWYCTSVCSRIIYGIVLLRNLPVPNFTVTVQLYGELPGRLQYGAASQFTCTSARSLFFAVYSLIRNLGELRSYKANHTVLATDTWLSLRQHGAYYLSCLSTVAPRKLMYPQRGSASESGA